MLLLENWAAEMAPLADLAEDSGFQHPHSDLVPGDPRDPLMTSAGTRYTHGTHASMQSKCSYT